MPISGKYDSSFCAVVMGCERRTLHAKRRYMNIYVGNISWGTTEDDLRQAFEEYGAVTSVNIITDRDTGRSKGFAFVEMENASDAEGAITGIDGNSVDGRNLRVNEARPKTDRPKRW